MSLICLLQFRWVQYRMPGQYWWACPQPHEEWMTEYFRPWMQTLPAKLYITCSYCYGHHPDYDHFWDCRGPYQRSHPKRSRLWCRFCQCYHVGFELLNSPCRPWLRDLYAS